MLGASSDGISDTARCNDEETEYHETNPLAFEAPLLFDGPQVRPRTKIRDDPRELGIREFSNPREPRVTFVSAKYFSIPLCEYRWIKFSKHIEKHEIETSNNK